MLGGWALPQAHRVVEEAVADQAVARTHVFAEAFHHQVSIHLLLEIFIIFCLLLCIGLLSVSFHFHDYADAVDMFVTI